MCLTIPKKVVSREGDFFIVEKPDGSRQKVKSIIDINVGDKVLTQQNIVVQKMEENEFNELMKLYKEIGEKGEKI
jgi:hydrogenase maturation factor